MSIFHIMALHYKTELAIFFALIALLAFSMFFSKVTPSTKTQKKINPTKQKPTNKNNINTKENIHQKNDGYATKTYRGTDIETAAWEDASFEKESGKSATKHLSEIETTVNEESTTEKQNETPQVEKNNTKSDGDPASEVQGVKASLMKEIITELKENRVQGVNSALESDSFTAKLAKQASKEQNDISR